MSTAPKPFVVEDLTEEEAYLYVILTDSSGLDQAEFLWYDPTSEDHKECAVCGGGKQDGHLYEHDTDIEDNHLWVDRYPAPSGCFRAWDYQVAWWRTDDRYQIDQSARSIGKSLGVKVRACAFPFLFPGEQELITAPELNHLEPLTQIIESQFFDTWLLREMLVKGRGRVTHRPFAMHFQNGSRIVGAIPQRDGKGVKGKHPVWLELDEAQDYPKAGWKELNETLKRGTEGARWRAHGVTRGVQDDFYEKTQDDPSSNWKVHRYPAMWRPTWTAKERNEAIQEYGSRDDPDYRRNVLGIHGDATSPIFVTTQLMRCCDIEPLSDYNSSEYYYLRVKAEELEYAGRDQDKTVNILQFIDFPPSHLAYMGTPQERAATRAGKKAPQAVYWVGMDVGRTTDPSEILVFVEHVPPKSAKGNAQPQPKPGQTCLKLLTRISLIRMPGEQQLLAMLAVLDFYHPRVFAVDKNGIGSFLWDIFAGYVEAIKDGHPERVPAPFNEFDLLGMASKIKGYAFGEKVVVRIDPTAEVGRYEDPVEKAGEKRETKDYSTDVLRELVDGQRLWLPYDTEFLKQFQGATFTVNSGRIDQYGRKAYSKGNDHCLDASREMVLGWALDVMEEFITKKPKQPVYDSFV